MKQKNQLQARIKISPEPHGSGRGAGQRWRQRFGAAKGINTRTPGVNLVCSLGWLS